MLTRTCTNCNRKNTTVKVLKPSEPHYVNMKCKYHWKTIGSLGAPVLTNPFNPTTKVPGVAGPSYSQLIIADGATNYWRLNETSGLTAVDMIGGKNGTISGAITLGVPGAIKDGDKAVLFSGTVAGIVTPSIPFPTVYTFEVWLNLAATRAGIRTILSSGGGEVTLYTNNNIINFIRVQAMAGTAALTPNIWHHVVFTCDGSANAAIYIDSVLDKSGAGMTSSLFSSTLRIGRDSSAAYWSDYMDDLALYPVALTPAQILAHYNAGK